jgi:TonB family C-terminal domain
MSNLKFTLIVPLALAMVLSCTTATAATPKKKTVAKTTKTTAAKKTVVVQPIAYETVEKKPAYIGGDSALNVFVANNVQYPAEAKKNKEQGEVTVQFVIDEKGAIKDSKVLTSVSTTLDAEALRLINAMPAWIPGEQKGKKVAVVYQLPINFVVPTSKVAQVLANPVIKAVVDSGGKVLNQKIEEKVVKYGGTTVNSILNAVKKK